MSALSNRKVMNKRTGKAYGLLDKLASGYWVAILFVLLIIGPLFLFSEMSPLIATNPIKDSSIILNFLIDKKFYDENN